MIVHTRAEAQRVKRHHGLADDQVFALDEWRHERHWEEMRGKRLTVDNLDLMLNRLFGAPVKAVSCTRMDEV